MPAKTILAIDDNPKILFLLEKLIRLYFPEAKYMKAESGLQGMQLAIDHSPNVILLDILMPQPDGFEICEKIKEDEITQDIPVIFLSGVENNQENRLKAIEAGADAFLAKPVNNLELMLQLKSMLKINDANIKKRNEKEYLAEQVNKQSKKLKDELVRRKETEQQLKRQEKELRELNATKDKFFSIIGHDLKGPFNGILGLSQMIHELCKKEQYESLPSMTSLLKKAATQSYDLLSNLLEWSRTQSGRKRIDLQVLNLCSAISDTVNLVSLSAHHKNIKITSNCDVQIQVQADPDVLNTIIRNLLNNAVKYSHPGGEIVISALQSENEVVVSVKDEGVGINEELQKKLFKVGESVITPGTNKEKGTGWGLILCKEFIELHGGKIRFESEQNKGTTFYFNLPVNK